MYFKLLCLSFTLKVSLPLQHGSAAKRTRSRSSVVGPNAWKVSCQELINEMMENEDSGPFREPVNIELYPVSGW